MTWSHYLVPPDGLSGLLFPPECGMDDHLCLIGSWKNQKKQDMREPHELEGM